MALSFDSMIKQLLATFKELPDYRPGKNSQYEVKDAICSASKGATMLPLCLASSKCLVMRRFATYLTP